VRYATMNVRLTVCESCIVSLPRRFGSSCGQLERSCRENLIIVAIDTLKYKRSPSSCDCVRLVADMGTPRVDVIGGAQA